MQSPANVVRFLASEMEKSAVSSELGEASLDIERSPEADAQMPSAFSALPVAVNVEASTSGKFSALFQSRVFTNMFQGDSDGVPALANSQQTDISNGKEITVDSTSTITSAKEARLAIQKLSQQFGIPIYIHLPPRVLQLPGPPPPVRKEPWTLQNIPYDVRAKIFEYLLQNKALGEPVPPSETMRDQRYDLEPTILRVCRSFHAEGCHLLYGLQPFHISCDSYPSYPEGPLTRYMGDWRRKDCFRTLAAVKRVKHWVVLVDPCCKRPRSPYSDISLFVFSEVCRAFCDVPLGSIKIRIIPKNLGWIHLDKDCSHEVIPFLDHLGMLRNLGTCELEIRDATAEETGKAYALSVRTDLPEPLPLVEHLPDKYIKNLVQTAKSNAPIEQGFRMYDLLLTYCQAFERHPRLKSEMVHRCQDPWNDSEKPDRDSFLYPVENHYRDHPVEEGLRAAQRAALGSSCTDDFKVQRGKVIMDLEKKYQRICDASAALVQFTEDTKILDEASYIEPAEPELEEHPTKRRRLYEDSDDESEDNVEAEEPLTKKRRLVKHSFDPFEYNEPKKIELFSAIVLVKDYARSFIRDVPLQIRAKILKDEDHYYALFTNQPLEKLFRRLNMVLEYNGYVMAVQILRDLIDCIDEQFIDIQIARNNLFREDLDLAKRGVDIPACHPDAIGSISRAVEKESIWGRRG